MIRSRIALTVALMFSLPAAVVALENTDAMTEAEASESVIELLATAAEPVTETEATEAAEGPADAVAESEAPAPVEPASQAAVEADAKYAAAVAPATGTQRAARTAFPREDEVGAGLLPAQIEYFARLEVERGNLVARGDVFPAGSPMNQWLPAQVAYLDRVEQARIAAAQPREIARADAAPVSVPAAAPTPAADLVVAHRAIGQ